MTGVRAGIRRTHCGGRPGRARPISATRSPPQTISPRRARCRPQSTSGGGSCSPDLRHTERRRPSLGLPAGCPARECDLPLRDFSIFGSETDITLCGQAAVLPSSEASNSGLRALQEGSRAGLLRLAALPPDTLQLVADRCRASRSAREIGQGSAEFADWPGDIRSLAPRLTQWASDIRAPRRDVGPGRGGAAAPIHGLVPQRADLTMGWCRSALTSPGWRWAGSARTPSAAEAPWRCSTAARERPGDRHGFAVPP